MRRLCWPDPRLSRCGRWCARCATTTKTWPSQLDELRRKLGREGKLTSKQLPKKIVLDVRGMAVSAAFLDAFTTSVVERATSSWEQGFAHLEEFVAREGHARVLRSDGDYQLFNWTVTQRAAYKRGSLQAARIARLELITSWEWAPHAADWETGYESLLAYQARKGHLRVPAKEATANGFRLGTWVVSQRASHSMGALSFWRCARLEAVQGWLWDPFVSQWETAFSALKAFVEFEGHARILFHFRTADGIQLGAWCNSQRANYRKGSLGPERTAKLETIKDWEWNPIVAMWESAFAEIVAFVSIHGHARVPAKYRTKDGFGLGLWISHQRSKQANGTLASDSANRLEALTGWVWDAVSIKWEVGYSLLSACAQRQGHVRVPQHFVTADGFALGSWIGTQRVAFVKGKLSTDRIERLNALPGWVWNSVAAQWEMGYAYLVTFCKKYGDAWVAVDYQTADGFTLGTWAARQRRMYRRGQVDRARIARLEALPGWVWKAAN